MILELILILCYTYHNMMLRSKVLCLHYYIMFTTHLTIFGGKDMTYYITYGEFQKYIKDYYHQNGTLLSFNEITNHLLDKGVLKQTYAPFKLSAIYEDMTNEDFEDNLNSIVLTLTIKDSKTFKVQESFLHSNTKGVLAMKHPNYIKTQSHTHDYYEINYVSNGKCNFTFKNIKRLMEKGEIFIIPPFTEHEIVPKEEATVYTIMLQSSIFHSIFFSLLSENLLYYYFKTILQEPDSFNYLSFFVSNESYLEKIIRNLLMESNQIDGYGNSSCINWLSLFFLTILRNYDDTILHYNYQMGTDFSLMLQYIQHNYQTLTLSSLAELFTYSEPHLSTLIRQNTGYTYTDLIKKLRLSEALLYLTTTDLKIGEIADLIGYNSADHFSRVFRAECDISPQQYKKQHTKENFFLPYF